MDKTQAKILSAIAFAVFILGSNQNSANADVVCRLARISGFDVPYNEAKPIVGEVTSDISKMRVFVTAYEGEIYAHSNFKTPGFDFPTKLATAQKRINALDIVFNLVGEGTVTEARLRKAYADEVVFVVDKGALRKFNLSVDFDGAKRVQTTEEYANLLAQKAADARREADRLAAEVERRAAEQRAETVRKRAAKDVAYRETVRRELATQKANATDRKDRIDELSKHSTKDMHLFSVVSKPSGVEVQSGRGSIFVFSEELAQLKAGNPLAADHPLTKMLGATNEGAFVLYHKGEPKEASVAQADEMAFMMQKAYPKNRIYRDPFSEKTPVMAKRLNDFRVGSPTDFVTLLAAGSFDVTDWKIMQNILPDLKKKGFESNLVLEKGSVKTWQGGGGKAVTVISGHIDENLAEFIHELGKAGYFKDNFVLLNTCRELPTRGLATSISADYGGVGVFCYDSKIKAADVEDFLLALSDGVKSNPEKAFVDLINETIGKHRLNGVWTLCLHAERGSHSFVCYIENKYSQE